MWSRLSRYAIDLSRYTIDEVKVADDRDKGKIVFNGKRNGDSLGHEHLDTASLSLGGYSVTFKEDSIIIEYPYILGSYSMIAYERKFTLTEALHFSDMRKLQRVISIPAKDDPAV